MLSSRESLGLAAQSLKQCCRAQCGHANKCVPCGENMDLCLQDTLVHSSAVGIAMPKQPKIKYSQNWLGQSAIMAVDKKLGKSHPSSSYSFFSKTF